MPYPFVTQIRWQSANVFDILGFRGSRRVSLQAVAFGSLPAKKTASAQRQIPFVVQSRLFSIIFKVGQKEPSPLTHFDSVRQGGLWI